MFYDAFVKRKRVQLYEGIGAGPFSTTKSYWVSSVWLRGSYCGPLVQWPGIVVAFPEVLPLLLTKYILFFNPHPRICLLIFRERGIERDRDTSV